jgi:hypothetical protein
MLVSEAHDCRAFSSWRYRSNSNIEYKATSGTQMNVLIVFLPCPIIPDVYIVMSKSKDATEGSKEADKQLDEDEWGDELDDFFSAYYKPKSRPSTDEDQLRLLQMLASQWDRGACSEKYQANLLEYTYTKETLHFCNLKGEEKEAVDLLRKALDGDGNPPFVVTLVLMEYWVKGPPLEKSPGMYDETKMESISEDGYSAENRVFVCHSCGEKAPGHEQKADSNHADKEDDEDERPNVTTTPITWRNGGRKPVILESVQHIRSKST